MARSKKADAADDDIFASLASTTGGEVVGESEKSSKTYGKKWIDKSC